MNPLPAIFFFALIVSFFSKHCAAQNQVDLQKEIFATCSNSQSGCKCSGDFFKREEVYWSKLEIKCESFEKFHEMFSLTKKVYDGDPNQNDEFQFPDSYNPPKKSIIELLNSDSLPPEVYDYEEYKHGNYGNKENKVFEIIEVKIKVNKELLEVSADVDFDYLKYITKLTIDGEGEKCFSKIGQTSFLHNFTNIYTLIVLSDANLLNIYLPALSNLLDFQVTVGNAVNFFCAFELESCLISPKGLKNFSVLFRNSKKKQNDFNLYGKLRLPKIIDNLLITFSSHEILYDDSKCPRESGNNIKPTNQIKNIFESIEFEKVSFVFPEIAPISELPETLVSKLVDGIDKVKTEISIIGNEKNVVSLLNNVYQQGLQGKLVVRLLPYYVESIPYIYVPKINLDQSQFEMCVYGSKLLKHAHQQIYKQNEEDVLIIRGFHLSLLQVFDITTQNYETKKTIKFVRVYAYNFEVESKPYDKLKDFIEKKYIKFEFFYVNIGIAKQVTTEIDGLYPERPGGVISSKDFFYTGDFFKIQFISMKNFEKADPIFTRAITTCLIMNIGLYHKTAPSALLRDSKQLSTWYDVIQNSLKFDEALYDALEISRTRTAFKHLKDFITLSDNMNAQITRVPSISLQVLSENIQILSQAGRDIRDKSKHFETSLMLKDINTNFDAKFKKVVQAIGNSKIAILKASMQKSVSLGEIELRKQQDIEKQWNQSHELINFLTKEFEKFQKEVEEETVKFKKGVILATGLAVAEAASEAVNCILGIFTGGFNPSKALNAARKATKLATVIPKIINALKKIADLILKRKLLGTTFKKVKESWKVMSPKLTTFFNTQKMVIKDAWTKAPKDYSMETTKQLAKVKKFFETSGAIVESTQDIVTNTVAFLKAERTVRIGYGIDDPLNSLDSTIFKLTQKRLSSIQDALKYFRNDEEDAARNQGETINLIDVFQWRIAKEQVTGMIDTTLSDDVPEATGYRTALLKMLTTGEAKTQAILNQAALETSFSASVEARKLYINESNSAGEEISKTEEELKQKEVTSKRSTTDEEKERETKLNKIGLQTSHSLLDLDIEWEKFAIKLELVRLNEEYCNAYYYFHLEKCQDDLRIRPSDDLEKILSIQNMLLYQSNVKLQDLFPPPQTFTDLTFTFKREKYCDCFKKPVVNDLTIVNIDEQKEARNKQLEQHYTELNVCLKKYGAYKKDSSEQREIDKKIANGILSNCISSPIESVKESKQFIYKVDIDSSYFTGHERVRIDEVKVIFKGAKTSSGVIKIYAESSGISEDRYKDHCYKFIGDRWVRMLSYYSENSASETKPVPEIGEISKRRLKQVKADLKILSENIEAKLTSLEAQFQKQNKKAMEQVTFIETGNIHKGFEGLFTAPTVFTTWSFIVPDQLNPGLNLDDLNEIELKFSGSFIATDYTKTTIQCKIFDEENIISKPSLQLVKSKSKRIKNTLKFIKQKHNKRNYNNTIII